MSAFSPLEEDILDEVYFVSAYADIAESCGGDRPELQAAFKALLQNGFIQQLRFSDALGDYEKLETADLDQVTQFHYVASKKGLLAHNSR